VVVPDGLRAASGLLLHRTLEESGT